MSRILSKIFITGMISVFAATSFAQKGAEDGCKYGHGEDSIRCLKNLSLFAEYVKQKSYADAIPAWEITYNECPAAHVKIYTDGVKIMEYRIKKEKDKAKKDELIQMLLQVYDKRIKYFGNSKKYGTDYILGAKAMSLLKYKKNDIESNKEANEWLKKSIDGSKNKTQYPFLATYLTNTISLYKASQATAEDVVKSYVTISDILTYQISKSTKAAKTAKLTEVKDGLEKIFATSGAADCQTIETIFGPQLTDNKTNLDWLKLVNKLLARANCEDAQLLYDVSESLHAIEPSSSSAYGLARMYLKSNDLDKSVQYYNEAISLETDDDQKGTFYYQLGLIKFNQNKFAESRTAAKSAIELKPKWGEPYILIGDLYATSAKTFGKDEFEHKTAYWAAVDMYVKAKSIDPSVAANANKLITLYTKYFPGTEEIFFRNLKIGDSYSLGGWIGATTKVRAKK